MNARPLPLERRGAGPPLVLLHGFTGSARSMAGLAETLAAHHTALAPDLPGHGRAADRDCGFEAAVDALAATLAAEGHARAHWLGYSMGARLALGVAVRHPQAVESLLLVGARAGIEDPGQRAARREADEALAARLERDGIERFTDQWLAQELFASQRRLGPAFLAAARAGRLAQDPRGLAAALRGLGPGAQPPLFDALAAIAQPTLLMAGELDHAFVAVARDLAARLPRATVRVIAGAGHAAHLEKPEACLEAVHEFLRRADGPAGTASVSQHEETAA